MATWEAICACVDDMGAMPISTDLHRWATSRGVRLSDWDSRRWESHVAAAQRARRQAGMSALPEVLPLKDRPSFATVKGAATGRALLGQQHYARAFVVDAVAHYLTDTHPAVPTECGYQTWADRNPDRMPHYRAVALHGGLPALLPEARRLVAAGGPDGRHVDLKRRLARSETGDFEQTIRYATEHPAGFTAAALRDHLGQHFTRVTRHLHELRTAGLLHDGGRSTVGKGRPMLYLPDPQLEGLLAYARPARRAPTSAPPAAYWTHTARQTFAAAQGLPQPFTAAQLASAVGCASSAATDRLKHLARLQAVDRSGVRSGHSYVWRVRRGVRPPRP